MTSRESLPRRLRRPRRLGQVAALAACALSLATGHAAAGTIGSIGPSLLVSVNGEQRQHDLRPAFDAGSGAWEIHDDDFELSIQPMQLTGGDFLPFALTVQTLTAEPIDFIFGFLEPIALSGPALVSGELSGQISDLRGDGVAFDPLNPHVMTAYLNGAEVFGLGDGLPHPFGEPGDPIVHPYGPYNHGPTALPDDVWSMMQLNVSFGLSGYDRAELNGRFDLETGTAPVPEPGTFALMGLGLGAALIARRKRNSVRTEPRSH